MLPEFQKLVSEEQTVVKLRIRFTHRVLAGIPKSGKPLDFYMSSKHMSDQEKQDFQARVEAGKVSEEELEDIKATNCLIFEADKDGNLGLHCGNFKALLREMFTSMGFTQVRAKTADDGAKSAGGKQILQHMIHVSSPAGGSLVPFLKDGKPVKTSDGTTDRVKHISDASGKRSAIGQHEYFEPGVEMDVVCKWYAWGVHDMDTIKRAWAMAQDDGIGACRSQSFGRFEIVAWEVLNEPPMPDRLKQAKAKAEEKAADKKGKKKEPVVEVPSAK